MYSSLCNTLCTRAPTWHRVNVSTHRLDFAARAVLRSHSLLPPKLRPALPRLCPVSCFAHPSPGFGCPATQGTVVCQIRTPRSMQPRAPRSCEASPASCNPRLAAEVELFRAFNQLLARRALHRATYSDRSASRHHHRPPFAPCANSLTLQSLSKAQPRVGMRCHCRRALRVLLVAGCGRMRSRRPSTLGQRTSH